MTSSSGNVKKRFSLVPRYSFRDITDVTAEFLGSIGINFLMLDLDNTIAAYDEHIIADDVMHWINSIKNSGITLFIISNTTRRARVEAHCEAISAGFIMQSLKPSPSSLLQAMETSGFTADVSALAGDQTFTDTLAANRAGVVSVIVRPRRFTNPLLALRYFIELPFRALCRNKMY